MKTPLSLLLASTALVAALGLPTLAATYSQGTAASVCSDVCAAVFGDGDTSSPLIRVSGDDDDDDDDHGRRARRGHDHDDDDHDDDDHDDDDDDCDYDDHDDDCKGAAGRGNPAPAGTVAPPANGLFGNGAPPVAVTN